MARSSSPHRLAGLARVLMVAALAATGASFVVACVSEAPATGTKKKRTPVDPGDDFYLDEPPSSEEGLSPLVNEDSGAFTPAAERPAPAKSDAGIPLDGGDGGVTQPKVFCTGALAPGDLAISELLITSRAGSGDDGEWVEIRNVRTCWLNVNGVSVESPRGTSTNKASVTTDLELAPGATFVAADSADPVKNHGLPGDVIAWSATDVLKNDGDTVTVKLGDTVLDSLTYPAFTNLVAGRTLAFPADCPSTVRSDWARWSLTFDAYATGFEGTPNGANDDVACY